MHDPAPNAMTAPWARKPIDRRLFLAAAGATVPLVFCGAGAPTLTHDEQRLVQQIARVGAVYPAPFPNFGEAGPALTRITTKRLQSALARCTSARVTQVRRGVQTLTTQGVNAATQDSLLTGLASESRATSGLAGLVPLVALAVSTLSAKFDPLDDRYATLWLRGLVGVHFATPQPGIDGAQR